MASYQKDWLLTQPGIHTILREHSKTDYNIHENFIDVIDGSLIHKQIASLLQLNLTLKTLEPLPNQISQFWEKFKSWLYAVTRKDRHVTQDRREKRYQICGQCHKMLTHITWWGSTKRNCTVCGCGLSTMRKITNLIAYEETAKSGCKHPEGSQWRKQGV